MKNKIGVTLIELILVIAGLAILSFSLASFITEAMEAWVYIRGQETALSTGRTTLEIVIRELRRISRPQNIDYISSSECRFIDTASAKVGFRQSGTDLIRDHWEYLTLISNLLTSNLATPEGLSFYYYDSNLNPTAVIPNIRFIKVRLQIIKGAQGIILEDAARIRNL